MCVFFVFGIVKKCIRMCGKLVVLNISVMLSDSVLVGLWISLLGFMIDSVFGCMVIVWWNIVLMLKLNLLSVSIVSSVVLYSSSMVLIICI